MASDGPRRRPRSTLPNPPACQPTSGVDEESRRKDTTTSPWSAIWDAATVEYIADERRQASLDGYFEKFSAEQLDGIAAVASELRGNRSRPRYALTSTTPRTRSTSTATT